MYMHWFLFSLSAGFFFATSRLVTRYLLRKKGNALAFTALHDVCASLVILPLFAFIPWSFPTQAGTWVYFFGIVFFAFLSDWTAFAALKKIEASLYQMIHQIRHVLILFGGFLFFGEAVTIMKVFGIMLVIGGVSIALYDGSTFLWHRGVWMTVVSTVCAVIAFVFVKFTVQDFSAPAAAFFELLAVAALSLVFLRGNMRAIVQEWRWQRWGVVLAGFCFGAFELSLYAALSVGEISRVIPVTQSALVFAVLGGILLLQEYERLAQKIIGTSFLVVSFIFLFL